MVEIMESLLALETKYGDWARSRTGLPEDHDLELRLLQLSLQTSSDIPASAAAKAL